MTFWVPMHEEVKNENKIPTSEVDEHIIHLNNEMRGIIVKKKMKKKIENIKKIMILEYYVLKLLIEHNYCLLENDGGQNHQYIRSW